MRKVTVAWIGLVPVCLHIWGVRDGFLTVARSVPFRPMIRLARKLYGR